MRCGTAAERKDLWEYGVMVIAGLAEINRLQKLSLDALKWKSQGLGDCQKEKSNPFCGLQLVTATQLNPLQASAQD